jgi:hypothetical protein
MSSPGTGLCTMGRISSSLGNRVTQVDVGQQKKAMDPFHAGFLCVLLLLWYLPQGACEHAPCAHGVASDFHTASFPDPINPWCVINRPGRDGSLAIKLATTGSCPGVVQVTLLLVERAWKQLYPDGTFKYEFYDEPLAILY